MPERLRDGHQGDARVYGPVPGREKIHPGTDDDAPEKEGGLKKPDPAGGTVHQIYREKREILSGRPDGKNQIHQQSSAGRGRRAGMRLKGTKLPG